MGPTQVGIVYSKSQQVIRRVIHTRWLGYRVKNGKNIPIPDPLACDDFLIPHRHSMLIGEGWAEIPIPDYDAITNDIDIHKYLGLKGTPRVDDRCIVHDGKRVLAVICADPAIDRNPHGQVAYDITGEAQTGWEVVNGVAIPQQELIGFVYFKNPRFTKIAA